MTAPRVLPVIVSVNSADAPVELRNAFLTAEPAELAKIVDWAWRFGFEIAKPFVIELIGNSNPEELTGNILCEAQEVDARGVVVAGTDYLRRARVLDNLYEQLSSSHLELWSADLGSKPLAGLLEA